jgi:hypothetical protein
MADKITCNYCGCTRGRYAIVVCHKCRNRICELGCSVIIDSKQYCCDCFYKCTCCMKFCEKTKMVKCKKCEEWYCSECGIEETCLDCGALKCDICDVVSLSYCKEHYKKCDICGDILLGKEYTNDESIAECCCCTNHVCIQPSTDSKYSGYCGERCEDCVYLSKLDAGRHCGNNEDDDNVICNKCLLKGRKCLADHHDYEGDGYD